MNATLERIILLYPPVSTPPPANFRSPTSPPAHTVHRFSLPPSLHSETSSPCWHWPANKQGGPSVTELGSTSSWPDPPGPGTGKDVLTCPLDSHPGHTVRLPVWGSASFRPLFSGQCLPALRQSGAGRSTGRRPQSPSSKVQIIQQPRTPCEGPAPHLRNEKARSGCGDDSHTASRRPPEGQPGSQLGFLRNCSPQPPKLACPPLLAKDSEQPRANLSDTSQSDRGKNGSSS